MPAVESNAFFVTAEAMVNAVKHAHVTALTVTLGRGAERPVIGEEQALMRAPDPSRQSSRPCDRTPRKLPAPAAGAWTLAHSGAG